MYNFYLGTMVFPIAPGSVEIKDNFNNKTISLIDEGEINLIKKRGLREISFEAILPSVKYPFAYYPNGFKAIDYYIDHLENCKKSKKPVQFSIVRRLPHSFSELVSKKFSFWKTDVLVTIESLTWKEDVENGRDVVVSITLKEYRPYCFKKLKIKKNKKCVIESKKRQKKLPAKSYIVKKGDCLYNIAKKQLNDASRWKEIYALNKKIIEATAKKNKRKSSSNGHYIYPGTKLKLPS